MKEKAGEKTYLIEVTPIGKSPAQGPLSYFSTTKLSAGDIVRVPIRTSSVPSVVLNCRNALSARSDIRRAGYLLKKIRKSDITRVSIARETLDALEHTARFYATSVGTLIGTLMPKIFLEDLNTFLKRTGKCRKKGEGEYSRETLLLQMDREERFGQYRALVRSSFARGASVMFIVPTHLDIERARADLSRGITEFVHTWSLSSKKKEIKQSWVRALEESHPILLITTPAGLLFPRADIDTVILERENSRAYRTLTRPFIHMKTFIEAWAKNADHLLVLGDSVLSLESLWREKSGAYGESAFLRWRIPAVPTPLIDVKSKQNENGRFEIFSPELRELITKAVSNREKIFLFGARKGLAPSTVCGDCGTVLPCLNCGAPVVLHRRGEVSVYICHACGGRRESMTTCGYCGSWKLVPLGIGTAEIARQAHELFPHTPIHILDKDHAPTDAKARTTTKKFQEEGGILVGTELAFYHIDKIPYSAVVSLDALFSIPDFAINERIFYIVSRLRESTEKECLVQTRNIGKQILAWASLGVISDFYQSEIEERESLLYPPFSIFIKISMLEKGSANDLTKLKERLDRFKPDIYRDSLVIRLPRSLWPLEELTRELSLLPPHFSIKVDPESIL